MFHITIRKLLLFTGAVALAVGLFYEHQRVRELEESHATINRLTARLVPPRTYEQYSLKDVQVESLDDRLLERSSTTPLPPWAVNSKNPTRPELPANVKSALTRPARRLPNPWIFVSGAIVFMVAMSLLLKHASRYDAQLDFKGQVRMALFRLAHLIPLLVYMVVVLDGPILYVLLAALIVVYVVSIWPMKPLDPAWTHKRSIF